MTIDHVNPEAPWPKLRDLERRTADKGYELRERLAIYPGYALKPDPWIAGKMQEPVRRLAGPDGLADPTRSRPQATRWQDPEVVWKPRTIALNFAKGSGAGLREDAEDVYGSFDHIAVTREWIGRPRGSPARLDADVKRALSRAAHGQAISDEEALALFQADGDALEALCRVADDLRREAVGDEVTYVVNRNINFTNVCYTGCRFCAFAQREVDAESYTLSLEEVADRAQEASDYGATEVCIQGGLHPSGPRGWASHSKSSSRSAVPEASARSPGPPPRSSTTMFGGC